jgi:hypothetical protein
MHAAATKYFVKFLGTFFRHNGISGCRNRIFISVKVLIFYLPLDNTKTYSDIICPISISSRINFCRLYYDILPTALNLQEKYGVKNQINALVPGR